MKQLNMKGIVLSFSKCLNRASPCHFPPSSQPFSHVEAQQSLCSDPATGRDRHQLVAHQPGHAATACQEELCNGRPRRALGSPVNSLPHNTNTHTQKNQSQPFGQC